MSKPYVLHQGDCLEILRELPDCSVDSVVCDPPYGLSFMGKKWDYDVPGVEIWAECLRVLKPGGHLLAFAGTRTQHRMAVRIEDAGFEIRDMIAWVYGSGFPKSMDVSKAIDKAAGAVREVVGEGPFAARRPRADKDAQGSTFNDDSYVRPAGHTLTAPATEAARQWQGWGTALKPALEPITVARKPLAKGHTVAANVLAHGTGALNIDGCRVPLNGDYKCKANGRPSQTGLGDNYDPATANQPDTAGRWPANLVHDGSSEVVALFPANAGAAAPVKGSEPSDVTNGIYGKFAERVPGSFFADKGSAARFFYAAKASKKDRGEGNAHPTVKPTDLMAYLCRLVTPPGGVVLDPFMGSGSTGKAAMREGFRFIGMEMEQTYADIAEGRIKASLDQSQARFDSHDMGDWLDPLI